MILDITPTLHADAILALDRLNSWVRSTSYPHLAYGPKAWIYAMKRTVLRLAGEVKLREDRSIVVTVPCRDCGGTGRYISGWGTRFDHCYACNSSGEVALRFVESTIPAGGREIVWHTPWMKAGAMYDHENAVPVTDWVPNTPGCNMTPSEVCKALLVAEDAFATKTPRHHFDDEWGYDAAPRTIDQYDIHLGECVNATCGVCYRPVSAGVGHTARAGRIHWRERVCGVCQKLVPHYYEHFRKVPPAELTSDPIVITWILTH